ncbi:hypothetical protein V6N13_012388 [Hibiscus sabdariffa]
MCDLSDFVQVIFEIIDLASPSIIARRKPSFIVQSLYTEEEYQILTGRRLPVECRAELHTDYDGAAVRWGLTHHKESAADCCQACLDQAKHAKPGEKKCNTWVYSPSETGCYSPDKYEHKHMESAG